MIGQEEREAVLRVIERGILSGYQGNWSDAFYGGPEVKALEEEWANRFGAKHTITCNSATSGLWMACAAIGLNPGDEVIVTPYSMTCSASIPLHFGAKPLFADIEPDYFCLDPKSIEERITERTKAIIVVDLFGQPYDADAINAIAKKHGIAVIEDAAQAVGATYKGRYAGTLGDIGIFSLNRHKHIQCGEGGVVVTNNDDMAMRLRLAMNHGEAVNNDMQDARYSGIVGLNLRMTELQAAVAREQLKKLGKILAKVQSYAGNFGVKVRPGCEHAFYRYASKAMAEDQFGFYRQKRGYIKPIYRMPLFRSLGYPDGLCPTCEDVEENIVLAWLKEIS